MDSPSEKVQLVPTGKSVYHIVLAFLSTLFHGITIAFRVKTQDWPQNKIEMWICCMRPYTKSIFSCRSSFFLKLSHQLHNKLVHINNVTVLEVRAQNLVSSLWTLLQRHDRRILEIFQFHTWHYPISSSSSPHDGIHPKERTRNWRRMTSPWKYDESSFSLRDSSHRRRLIDSFRQSNSLL